ncbi:unnamed protein product [Rotaria socialis]
MKYSLVELSGLPDEILLMILKILPKHEAIYKCTSLNKRFNRILHDSTFTNRLALLTYRWNLFMNSLPDSMLDQFCQQILPKIHHKIQWLKLESSSMKRILLSINTIPTYMNLAYIFLT